MDEQSLDYGGRGVGEEVSEEGASGREGGEGGGEEEEGGCLLGLGGVGGVSVWMA